MRAALAGLADAGAAGLDARLPGGLDRDDPEPGEAEQPEARLWVGWCAAMKKTGLAMPQPIVSSSSKWRRQPSGASSES